MILDTNVYSALDRGVASAIMAIKSQTALFLAVPVIGELKFGFMNGNRQAANLNRLNKFIAQNNVDVLTPTTQTTDIYAELSVYCRRTGRSLSNNDVWIAALVLEHNMPLVTFDRDFLALEDRLGDKLILLED